MEVKINSKKLGGTITFYISDVDRKLMAEMPSGEIGEVWSLEGVKGDRSWWAVGACCVSDNPQKRIKNLYNRIDKGTVRIFKELKE